MIQQELQRDDQTLQTIGQIDAQIQSIYNNLEALSVQTNPDVNKQNALLQQIQKELFEQAKNLGSGTWYAMMVYIAFTP